MPRGSKQSKKGGVGVKIEAVRFPSRRLLISVQHSVNPKTIHLVFPVTGLYATVQQKDIIDPLIVKCPSPKVSLTLAFDNMKPDNGAYTFDVVVRDVDSPDVALEIEATVEWYKRRNEADVTKHYKYEWPAPERPIKVTLGGEGLIGTFVWGTMRALTVHLDVYAMGASCRCPSSVVLGGLNALRLDKTLSDVELKVDGEVFPAHRAVLATNSPVFRSMFTSDLKEAEEGVVEVEGASSNAFGLFLEFLYSGTVVDWKDCVIELLELADRYMVDHLKAVCEERLLHMDWRTALRILQHADKPVITSDTRVRAMQVVVDKWDAVQVSPQWKDFVASAPSTPVALADWIGAARNNFLLGPTTSSHNAL